MAAVSTVEANKLNDLSNGVTAYALPTIYVGLINLTAKQSPRSTAVTANQTTAPAAPNGHTYRCTTAGTTGSSEPTWPTTSGGTVTDGAAVWTEQTPDYEGNTNVTEANYTGYTRVALSGLMGTSSGGSASNTSIVAFPNCTGGTNTACGFLTFDASTGGNLVKFGPTNSGTTLAVISTGNPEASFAIGALMTSQT